MAKCFLCGNDANLKFDAELTKQVWGNDVKTTVPIDVCATCKATEAARVASGSLKLVGIAVAVAVVIAIIAGSGWALIGGLALGGLLTYPLKFVFLKPSKFNEHPQVLEKKKEGFKLTFPSR